MSATLPGLRSEVVKSPKKTLKRFENVLKSHRPTRTSVRFDTREPDHLAHFSVYAAMGLRKSSGEPGSPVDRWSAGRALILRSASAALIRVSDDGPSRQCSRHRGRRPKASR